MAKLSDSIQFNENTPPPRNVLTKNALLNLENYGAWVFTLILLPDLIYSTY